VLGNSARTLHPNGAQGFNLGLRDVAGLAEVLIPAIKGNKDLGQKELLDNYITLRKKDQKCVTQFSNGLASLFYNNLPHKVLVRNIGMIFIDMIPALKNSFMRRTMGLHGKQPAMVRGLAL
jgi:2-octaprenyl-6-methoxyphenol hydroxylase